MFYFFSQENLSASIITLQNRKQELIGQIDRVMTACTITPDQVVSCINY